MLGRGEMLRSGKGGQKIGCCRVSIEKVENGRAIDNQRGISVRILFSVERIVMIIRNIFWMYTMRGFWFKIWIRIRVLNTKRILEFQ